jgi:hypothetical protein
MGIRELRAKHEGTFMEFWNAYPRHTDRIEAFDQFIQVAEEGCDVGLIITKAKSYALNVDPEQLKFVPSPARWIRNRRWEDEDLFTDAKTSNREWFVRAWKEADAASVERKYGYVYPDPAIPQGVTDIQKWCEDDRRRWVAEIANHVINKAPLPD